MFDDTMAKRRKKPDTGQLSPVNIAGYLLIITGIVNVPLAIWAGATMGGGLMTMPVPEAAKGVLSAFIMVCAAVVVAMSIVTIVGGYYALKRRKFMLVMIGGALGLVTLGPFCLTSFLAAAALLIVYSCKDQFRD
jgi:hypothetical protein